MPMDSKHISDRLRLAALFSGGGLVLLSSVGFVLFRFAYPDMTSIRALLAGWPFVVGMVGGTVLMGWSREAP